MRCRFGLSHRQFITVVALVLLASPTAAQLRVGTWNITNYSGGRIADLQGAIYGVFEGRTFAPDVLLVQEVLSNAGNTAFLNALNSAPGGPGDWAAAPFVDGPDTDSAFFYRTSKVDYLGMTVVSVGGASPNQPRNIQRYDVRLKNYTAASATIALYSSHMKAQESGSDDDLRRLTEAQRIRDNAEILPAGWHFIYGGDTNIQTSSSAEYQELVGSQVNNAGRFFDPIKTPGSWNNNFAFRFVHTQDPVGAGGMDDRHDQILLSAGLIDGDGLDYIGDSNIPYSTSTWNDPNHSYRAWGNDGTTYNTSIAVAGNLMVGAAIAQDIKDSTGGVAGHLPVFLDLRVPAEVASESILDFGTVNVGDTAQATLNVSNAGLVALWTASGIDDLDYSLSTSAGFSAPGGSFTDAAGGAGNAHTISMDTSSPGVKNGILTIASNAPDEPARVVTLVGEVVSITCEPCDTNCDGTLNPFDVQPFLDLLLLPEPSPCSPCAGDADANGTVNPFDVTDFLACLNP